jgi:SAM-dependent methyltransferase
MGGANIKAGMDVLEIGCGTGNFTEVFATSGAKITAVDISPDLLELAFRRNLDPQQVKFLECRFEEMDTPQQFDAIIGSSVLHHLDLRSALVNMHRLLKPAGVLSFAEPNMMNPQVYAMFNFEFLKDKFGVSPDERAFYRWRIQKQIGAAGFVEILVKPFDFLHPSIPSGGINFFLRMGDFFETLPLIREFSGSLYIFARKPNLPPGMCNELH